MHAANDAIGLEHDVAARRWSNDCGVIHERKGAGVLCKRSEIFCDEAVLTGLLNMWFAYSWLSQTTGDILDRPRACAT